MNTHNHLDHRHQCVAALLFAVLASLGVLSPLPLAAQEVALEPGDRIRVRPFERPRRGPHRITGSLVSIEADTLKFDRRGEIQQYSLSEIKTLEMSTGEKDRLTGTVGGIVIGGLIGGFLGAEFGKSDTCRDVECEIISGIFWAGIGGAVGGIAGYHLLASEKWTKVQTGGLNVSLGPGTLVLRLSL